MIGVAGRTILDNSLELLKNSGINDIFVVVGHRREKLIEALQEHDYDGLNIHYLEHCYKLKCKIIVAFLRIRVPSAYPPPQGGVAKTSVAKTSVAKTNVAKTSVAKTNNINII